MLSSDPTADALSAGDDFMQIVEAATARKPDAVVMLIEAYFDESYGKGGVLCVAGYAFTKMHCGELDRAWRNMLKRYDLPFFRMSACAHGRKPFDKLTRDQCIAVEKEAIGLIKRYAACGFAVTVDPTDFDQVARRGGLVAEAYELVVWIAILTVRTWMEDSGRVGSVAYFFEAGHEFQSKANGMMDKAFKDERLRKICMYRSHTFMDKRDSRPAQSADLLAWRWFTDKKRKLQPERFPNPRKDFQSLVEADHKVVHADASFLQWMMDGLREMYGQR